MKRVIAILLIVVLLLPALGGCDVTQASIPVLIDCDPGMDDAIALGLAAASDKLDIVALCAVQGNVWVDRAVFNLLELANLYGIDAPVYVGREHPLEGYGATDSYYHGLNGIAGAVLPATDRAPETLPAWDAIYEQAKLADGKLQILALGPLTNVAVAFEKYPDLPAMLDRVVVMGGAVEGGNATAYAEFNTYNDPKAAQIVFESGVEIVMASLDAGEQTYLTGARTDELCGDKHPLNCLYDPIGKHMQTINPDSGLILCDPLAAAYMIDPSVAKGYRANVTVDVSGGEKHGQTVVEPDEKGTVTVLDTADNDKLDKQLAEMFAYFGAREPVTDAVPVAQKIDPAEIGLLVSVGSDETVQTEISEIKVTGVVHTDMQTMFICNEQWHETTDKERLELVRWEYAVTVQQNGQVFPAVASIRGSTYASSRERVFQLEQNVGFDATQPCTFIIDGQTIELTGLAEPTTVYQSDIYRTDNMAEAAYLFQIDGKLWTVVSNSETALFGYIYTPNGEQKTHQQFSYSGLSVLEYIDKPVRIEFPGCFKYTGDTPIDTKLSISDAPQLVDVGSVRLTVNRVTLQDGTLTIEFAPSTTLYVGGALGRWSDIESQISNASSETDLSVLFGAFDMETYALQFQNVPDMDSEIELCLQVQVEDYRPNYMILPS